MSFLFITFNFYEITYYATIGDFTIYKWMATVHCIYNANQPNDEQPTTRLAYNFSLLINNDQWAMGIAN